jgi:hypothetical protein
MRSIHATCDILEPPSLPDAQPSQRGSHPPGSAPQSSSIKITCLPPKLLAEMTTCPKKQFLDRAE